MHGHMSDLGDGYDTSHRAQKDLLKYFMPEHDTLKIGFVDADFFEFKLAMGKLVLPQYLSLAKWLFNTRHSKFKTCWQLPSTHSAA